jgi:peptidoglycan endopeptidase LytE
MNRRFFCTALMTMLLSLFMLSISEANVQYKVKKGDNLSKISKKFKVPVDELREANKLGSDDLSVGKKLTIPSKKSSKTAKAAKVDKTEKVSQATHNEPAAQKNADAADGGDYEYHVVRKGDTPARIAKKYGLSVSELKKLNHLTSSKLKPGRRLIVGISSDEEEDAAQTSQPTKRINVSEKIEEVRSLSQSDELSKLSATERLLLFAKKMLDLPYKFGGNGIFALD